MPASKRACELYGAPRVGVDQMIEWIAHWIERGGASHGKPTYFEVRDGKLMLSRQGDFILVGGKFPRLTSNRIDLNLSEVWQLIKQL